MRRRSRILIAVLVGAASAAIMVLIDCGGSSTSPSNPPPVAALQSVAVSPTSVAGGTAVQGTVTLSTGAPAGGATVTLASSNPAAATVPASVVVPQGSASATFNVTTLVVASSTTADISGTYAGITQKATLSVAAAIHADFIVTPDAGTAVSAGQCSATQVSGTATQKLNCTFDGRSSTPNPGITAYQWTLPGASMSGATLSDPIVPCGGFSSAGSARDVTLVITAPGGSDTVKKSVTFIKGAPC